MAIIRVEKTGDYTVLSNYHLRDKRLSLRAIGLLSKMLSLPPDWDYTVAGLAAICREGRDAVAKTLNELEECGYMERSQGRGARSKFGKNEYTVREKPVVAANLPLSEKPSTAEPSTVSPLTANEAQINKDLINNLDNIPPIVPQEGDKLRKTRKRREPKRDPDWMPERFAAFWTAYPRKESKQDAIAAWDKLHADEGLLNLMAKALARQLKSEDWGRGIGIPYAATWINKRRWEDEPSRVLTDSHSPGEPSGGSCWAEDTEVRYV